jgi:hypothetical protein
LTGVYLTGAQGEPLPTWSKTRTQVTLARPLIVTEDFQATVLALAGAPVARGFFFEVEYSIRAGLPAEATKAVLITVAFLERFALTLPLSFGATVSTVQTTTATPLSLPAMST